MDTNEIDEVVQEFLLESYENLDRLDDEFLELERDPSSTEVLASIFRTIHTIKGTAGFLGFDRLGQLTHAGENLLSRLRNGDLTLNQPRTNALLSLVDAVREMLAAIEEAGVEGNEDHDAVMAALNAAMLDDETAEEVVAAALDELASRARAVTNEVTTGAAAAAAAAAADAPPADAPATAAASPAADAPVAATAAGIPTSATPTSAPAEPAPVVEPGDEVEQRKADGPRSALSDSTVRIDVSLLDNLMNLVGELVLARNRILQVSATDTDSLLHNTAQQLNLVTSELQEEVMRTRLQPIQTIWGRFPRVVRDLAVACEKQVRIEMAGEDTELDRTIVEAIRDPLTHMIRNAVDHGVEMPDVRVANGKPAEGTIWLSAYHEGSQVNIEMRDDGGGIDLDAVGAKAVSRGLVTAEALERMTERQLVDLIFEPGLSTAGEITNVSGRGVGMDVVRSNIEKIGGSVEASTVKGQGTTMRMKIPLTLAIVPALVVHGDDQPFAIPQVNVLELVRLDGSKAEKAIESVGRAKVYRLRGQLLPILDVREALGLPNPRWADDVVVETRGLLSEPVGTSVLTDRLRARAAMALHRERDGTTGDEAGAGPVDATSAELDVPEAAPPVPAKEPEAINIVVLKADNTTFGLVVDRIDQTQEIVVKPLGAHLKEIPVYAGTTVMGDGHVALILDAVGLAKHSQVASVGGTVGRAVETATVETNNQDSVLVCKVGSNRVALELPVINRLEFIATDRIERSNGHEVVQYHEDRLLHLVRVEEFLGRSSDDHPAEDDQILRVIVCEHEGEYVGLVVDDIVDIATRNVHKQQIRNEGIVTVSAVVSGKVTDLLDVDLILAAASTPALSRW